MKGQVMRLMVTAFVVSIIGCASGFREPTSADTTPAATTCQAVSCGETPAPSKSDELKPADVTGPGAVPDIAVAPAEVSKGRGDENAADLVGAADAAPVAKDGTTLGDDLALPETQTSNDASALTAGDLGNTSDALSTADGTAGPGSPQILQLTVNMPVMTEEDTLVITAIVTDPNGLSDILGGTLLDPETLASYGTFTEAEPAGAYMISLSWWSIAKMQGFYTGEYGVSRTFSARFFDASGNAAQAQVAVMLNCRFIGYRTCGGEACVNIISDPQHCGACNAPVPDNATCQWGSISDGARVLCGGTWFENSIEHCGACGNSCDQWRKSVGISDVAMEGRTMACVDHRCRIATERNASSPAECIEICASLNSACDHTIASYGACGTKRLAECQLAPPGEALLDGQYCELQQLTCHCPHREQTDDEKLQNITR